MKARRFNNLRTIFKRWLRLERQTEMLESEAMDAGDERWRAYHMKYGEIRHHIRRIYLMYPDAVFFYSSVNAISDWLKD